MRIMIKIHARADAAYDHKYHHKLRGRIWRALRGTPYDERHDSDEFPGFSYSNPFPPRDMQEGDERTLLVASPDEQLLAHIAANLLDDRELNIGDMPFRIADVRPLDPDVGPPGTSGVLETGTGVLVDLTPARREEYGIAALDREHADGDDVHVYWRPKHTTAPFFDAITANLERKHDAFGPAEQPGPADVDAPLFDGFELIKKFALPVKVTTTQELTLILSKWRFEYTVRDQDHRRHLNLALDCGIGSRNALGLGFVNCHTDVDSIAEFTGETPSAADTGPA